MTLACRQHGTSTANGDIGAFNLQLAPPMVYFRRSSKHSSPKFIGHCPCIWYRFQRQYSSCHAQAIESTSTIYDCSFEFANILCYSSGVVGGVVRRSIYEKYTSERSYGWSVVAGIVGTTGGSADL
jgi:hypothetical protein